MRFLMKAVVATTILACVVQCMHPTNDIWIVVTTINSPTKAVKQLATLGCNVVVVADKKTPKDWNVPGITFIDVPQQETLAYRISKYIPWNHYARKNIGYLYAIAHGARVIYETDDDNFLIDEKLTILPEYHDQMNEIGNTRVVNPYAYFGQPTVWPRGYPLKSIYLEQPEIEQANHIFTPIQQGLVDLDPDVDAIFRLTRPEPVHFKLKIGSLALKRGSMAPFNSQNTVFHYSSFWALLIPASVSLRVADIWRGYWAQRLLWDLGGQLCFTQSNAYQERNEHDLLKDFIEELDLYLKVDPLIDFLNKWKSNSLTFEERMIELFEQLVEKNFIKTNDLDLVVAWILDLKEVGYKFPPLAT